MFPNTGRKGGRTGARRFPEKCAPSWSRSNIQIIHLQVAEDISLVDILAKSLAVLGIRSYHLDDPRLQASGQDLTVFSCVPFSPLPPSCVPNTERDSQKSEEKKRELQDIKQVRGSTKTLCYDVHIF